MLLRRIILAGVLLAIAPGKAWTQAAARPGSYTVKETNSMLGPTITMAFYKNGSKAALDEHVPIGQGFVKEVNSRSVFNLETKQGVTWGLGSNGPACGPATIMGDWGDPFISSATMSSEMLAQKPRELGTEPFLGLTARMLELKTPEGRVKVWLDTKYGLLLKIVSTPPGSAAKTVLEVTEISLTAPDAAVFVPVAGCPAM